MRYSVAMNRAVIVCGAKIKDYEFVSSFFSEGDFFIYCDSGLIHEDRFLSKVDTLDNATINPKYQYAISNEVAGDEPARVSVEKGVLLLIKNRF